MTGKAKIGERTGLWIAAAAVAALAIGALLAGAPAAEAGKKQVRTKVSLKQLGPEGASGKVSSKVGKCKRRRTVVLLFADEYAGVRRIAKTKTKRSGRWAIDRPLVEKFGVYYAKVKRQRIGRGKRKRVCKGATSAGRRL